MDLDLDLDYNPAEAWRQQLEAQRLEAIRASRGDDPDRADWRDPKARDA